MTDRKVCLVIGAGDATGAAIAKRFARGGLHACVVRRPRHTDQLEALAEEIRQSGDQASAHGVDARDEEQMVALIERIESAIGPIEVAVFNIGANVRFPITEMTARVYYKVWQMGSFAGFLMGREVAKRMIPRGRGTILFTGATASVRGGAGFAAFAGAKFALRALAQSMARELGQKNIHVAHLVVDGAIDTEWIKANFPDRYAAKAQDGILNPNHIAETYWAIHSQPRSAWTHELDVRPWSESW